MFHGLFLFSFFGLLATAFGYGVYLLLIRVALPWFYRRDALSQRGEMLAEADRQGLRILEDQKKLQDTNLALLQEDLEDELISKRDDLKLQDEDLFLKAERDIELEATLEKREQEAEAYRKSVEEVQVELKAKEEKITESSQSLLDQMSLLAQVNQSESLRKLESRLLDEKHLELKKQEKQELELLNSVSGKVARRSLTRVLSRYSPEFYWPKPVNLVEVSRKGDMDRLESESFIEELREVSGVTINLLGDEEKQNHSGIKVVGGYGIAKESARLTLERLLNESPGGSLKRWRDVYDGFFQKLTTEAYALGKKAVDQLQLKGVHPEIQKLVGALNWRTSYRQNQWYHTVEVATLAGILAHELGEDPDAAKRVGLLHDIGKVLDYKINTSHAIISADYADRYGEKRFICDTVMSHHADLVLETPLAYILQTADCLSGARPGARVNLEEGYQIRLSAIQEAVHSFPGIYDVAIMNGGREVHVQVINKKVPESELPGLAKKIARKIEEMVNYPGKIKVMVTRTFESVKVA